MWQAIIRGQLHHLQLMETQFFYLYSPLRMFDTIGCHLIVNSFHRNAHHVHWSVFVSVSETAGWLCFVLAVRDPCGLDYWIIGQKNLR